MFISDGICLVWLSLYHFYTYISGFIHLLVLFPLLVRSLSRVTHIYIDVYYDSI